MNIFEFMYEKINITIINIFSMVALVSFLRLLSTDKGAVFMIIVCWILIIGALYFQEYFRLKRKYTAISEKLSRLDQKYLICEVLGKPSTLIEKIYYDMLRSGNKSMIEQVEESREIQISYKEYIEEWIHEIKSPITAIDLICKNHSS